MKTTVKSEQIAECDCLIRSNDLIKTQREEVTRLTSQVGHNPVEINIQVERASMAILGKEEIAFQSKNFRSLSLIKLSERSLLPLKVINSD